MPGIDMAIAPGPIPGLLPHLFTTSRHLPAADQFAFWQATCTMSSLSRPEAAGTSPFLTEEQTWRFGRMALMLAEAAPSSHRRLTSHIRKDSLDHWAISVATEGNRRFRSGDVSLLMAPGSVYVT